MDVVERVAEREKGKMMSHSSASNTKANTRFSGKARVNGAVRCSKSFTEIDLIFFAETCAVSICSDSPHANVHTHSAYTHRRARTHTQTCTHAHNHGHTHQRNIGTLANSQKTRETASQIKDKTDRQADRQTEDKADKGEDQQQQNKAEQY